MRKVKTILWFIKNPKYISQIWQVRRRRKNALKENTSKESIEWCQKVVVSDSEALKALGVNNLNDSLASKYSDLIKKQREIVAEIPVQMGGEGSIDFLYSVVNDRNAKRIIETGVAYGWSSLAILLAIKNIDGAKLISNDMPYIKMNNEDFVGCVVPENLKSKWELQRQADVKGIPTAIKKFAGEIDVCHYDSDKSYTGRMFAYPLLWDALVQGGLFISDDIQDNIAFKEFAENCNRKPIVIEHLGKYVGVIVK